ncbi:MAG: PilZ domain-containing protein [Afipia sp.]|nr:PilZ domain-containing protein [Afipia sp.]
MKKIRVAVRRKDSQGSIVVGSRLVTCTVHNLSATGAALSIRHSAPLSDAFVLILELEHRQRPCRVVWRRGDRVGVTFRRQRSSSRSIASKNGAPSVSHA